MGTTQDYEPNVVLSTQDFNVVGTRPLRPDGSDKVTGRALYGADFAAAGLLQGKILRSPHAHARIKSIDTSKAEALNGVRAVVTSADFPQGGERPVQWQRDNLMASTKVLYKGHAVAAVAATNVHIAEAAANLIEVDYEILPIVSEVRAAMEDDSVKLHDDLKTNELGQEGDAVSNIAQHFQHTKGDVEAGFAEADVVIEREFTTKSVHQGYIEPHVATALWNNDGRLHIWCSTQGAFAARDASARILDLPVSQIRVTPMEIGGGFGGKIDVYLEPTAALLSKKTGTPVKLVMSRADVFQGSGPTPGTYMKMKVGAKKDGSITAAHAWLAMEAGAYPGSPVGAGAMCVLAAYDLENALVDGYDVVVNKPKTAAYRAPGAPNAAFACESVMDEVAKALDMDPIDFRMKNASKEGTRQVHGPVFPRIGYEEVLEAMKNTPHYNAPLEGDNKGRGLAVGFWFNIGFDSACNIAVNADGTVSLQEGSTDIGGTRASIAMQAAEVLTIPYEDVRPTVVDTDSVGFTAVTGGSRTTFATGWAAHEAAQDVVSKMIARVAQIWEVEADSIELENGEFKSKADSELNMSFKDLAGQLGRTGGGITGTAAVSPTGAGGAFSGHIVDVEVDPETGKTEILRYTAVQDAGKAIHPSYVEGQMQGGAGQGIGWALNEEYYFNDGGTMDNVSLLDYRMPTSLDMPMIDTVIVEVANPGHPYGVRGVGEAAIVPPTPAISNAIENAIGIRLRDLPMNAGAVAKAMQDK